MFSRDPQAKLQERIAATDSRPWTMWAPMLPLQMPDPAIGLPAGTVLQPTIFVRNTTAKPAAASINLSWRSAAAKGVAKLKDMNLAAFETSQIPIGALQKQLGIPDDAHWALVTLSTAGMPDDLMADAASYDSTGRYGLEAPFSDNLGNWFMGGEWRVDANHNQLMVVTNSGQKPTDALLTLHYDEGGKSKSYEMRQTIQPGEQMWVNLAELIRNRLADRRGNLLPADLVNGTYDLRDLGPRPGALTISSVMPDSVRGNPAGAPLATCCGVYSAAFFPDLISVLDMGLPFDFTAQGTNECTHSPEDLFTDVISWWSGNPAIAKVTPGKVQGSATGTTTANGETDPIYVGMGTNCILKYFYPIAPVTVFAFGVTGKNYIFVGSDPNELYGNHYYATNGSGGAPQPPGGTCCAASSDQSDAVSPIGGTGFQFETSDQSATVGDRTLTFEYDLPDGGGTSQQMNVTARQFAYATNNSPSNTCSQYGYSYTYVYTPYTHPDHVAVSPTDGISGTGVTEVVTPQSGGTVCTNYQETGGGAINSNAQFQDFVSLCSNSPIPTCDKKYTQTLSVAGYQVRTNTLEFRSTSFTYTSQGPTQ
jgi:hypothetical protein